VAACLIRSWSATGAGAFATLSIPGLTSIQGPIPSLIQGPIPSLNPFVAAL
jgi:hypothetical protein